MAKSSIDANVNNEIFRKNWTCIIALKRELAVLSPVRLAYEAGGWTAGQVLARNTVTGLFEKYSAASGTYDASCVLFEDVDTTDQAATGGALARGIFSGALFKDALIDYDANAKTELNARDWTDASSTNIMQF